MSARFGFTRRAALIATAAAVAAGAAGFEWLHHFGRRYAPTQFDDLFAKLNDRDASAVLGSAIMRERGTLDPYRIASTMRSRLAAHSVAELAVLEARQGKITEAGRWVVPESVMLMAALAASGTLPASR